MRFESNTIMQVYTASVSQSPKFRCCIMSAERIFTIVISYRANSVFEKKKVRAKLYLMKKTKIKK